ncbi:hypothetical protein Tco_1020113 [Tanacetum coccineum]|uniref:Uncharacterized protein n=1 Tax=Tanacetum coccineum TaxID=301880 RepID=A0ABQ5G0K1_9ASTR
MVEPEVPLKKKDQIALDEELTLRLHAEEQAGFKAMIDADEQLSARLQAEEKEQFSIEEKSRMLVEMIAERKKFFAAQRAAEQRNSEEVKSSKTRIEESSKRAGNELESDKSKKQKTDEYVKDEKDDDQEEAEMKKHIEIVKDDEVAIDAIPLAIKPPVIVKYKIVKEGKLRNPPYSITISNMLNKKLQADHWNEMCYQLLKLIAKKEKWGGLLGLKDFKMILRVTTAQHNVHGSYV